MSSVEKVIPGLICQSIIVSMVFPIENGLVLIQKKKRKTEKENLGCVKAFLSYIINLPIIHLIVDSS